MLANSRVAEVVLVLRLGATSKADIVGIDFGVRQGGFGVILEEVILKVRVAVWRGQ